MTFSDGMYSRPPNVTLLVFGAHIVLSYKVGPVTIPQIIELTSTGGELSINACICRVER
jgi:hypothetical protein